jgi:transposase InsO family protein
MGVGRIAHFGRSQVLLHHELRAHEKAEDAVEVLDGAVELALSAHGQAAELLMSDHGKCSESRDTHGYLRLKGIRPVHARAHHPQTLGKMERLHRTMKEEVPPFIVPKLTTGTLIALGPVVRRAHQTIAALGQSGPVTKAT